MAWQELSITVPHEYVEPVSYLFGRYGKGVSTELAGNGQLRAHLHGSRRGDLLVTVDVRVPGSLDNRQQELLRELAESFAQSNGSSRKGGSSGEDGDDKGLFDKIKEVLS